MKQLASKVVEFYNDTYPNSKTHNFEEKRMADTVTSYICKDCNYCILVSSYSGREITHTNLLCRADPRFPTCNEFLMDKALE